MKQDLIFIFNLANSYSDFDFIRSEFHYSNAILLNPFEPTYWYNYYLLLKRFNDDSVALSRSHLSIKQAILLDPLNSDYLLEFGNFLLSQHKSSAARSLFHFLISIDPLFLDSYINLATLYFDHCDIQSCLDVVALGLSLDADNHHLLFIKSLCFLRIGNFRDGWSLYSYRPLAASLPKSLSILKNYFHFL